MQSKKETAALAMPRMLALTPLAMLCAACGEKPILIVPPIELTTCADEPLAPDLPAREFQAERDRMMLDFTLDLRAAWGDCKAKVDGLKKWREEATG